MRQISHQTAYANGSLCISHSLNHLSISSGNAPHRVQLSFWGAVFNLVTGAVGAGLLAMPSVMGTGGEPRAGFVGGCALLLVAAVFQRIANRCISNVIDTVSPDAPCASLEMLAKLTLGTPGQVITSIVANLTTLSFPTAYIILLGNGFSVAFGFERSLTVACTGLLLIPLSLCSLSDTAGLVATVATCLVMPIIIAGAFIHGPSKEWSMFGNAVQLGPSFCTILFANGIGFLVPAVKANMTNSVEMAKASDVALAICLAIYGVTMGLSYYSWGDEVQGNILDSIESATLGNIGRVLLLVNLIISYSIMINVTAEGLGPSLRMKTAKQNKVLRICLGLFITVIAVLVPCYNEFIDLAAAVTIVACNFIIPPACYWSTRAQGIRNQDQLSARRRPVSTCTAHALMLTVGLAAMVFGVIGGLQNLAKC